eukprot:152461_1
MDNDNNKNHSLIEKLKSDHATEIKALNDENKDKTEQITKLEKELSKMLPKAAATTTTTAGNQIDEGKKKLNGIENDPRLTETLNMPIDNEGSDVPDLTEVRITLTDHKITERIKDFAKDMFVDLDGESINLIKVVPVGKKKMRMED